jgi:hypothetical protein
MRVTRALHQPENLQARVPENSSGFERDTRVDEQRVPTGGQTTESASMLTETARKQEALQQARERTEQPAMAAVREALHDQPVDTAKGVPASEEAEIQKERPARDHNIDYRKLGDGVHLEIGDNAPIIFDYPLRFPDEAIGTAARDFARGLIDEVRTSKQIYDIVFSQVNIWRARSAADIEAGGTGYVQADTDVPKLLKQFNQIPDKATGWRARVRKWFS